MSDVRIFLVKEIHTKHEFTQLWDAIQSIIDNNWEEKCDVYGFVETGKVFYMNLN